MKTLTEVQEDLKKRQYQVVCYMRVDPAMGLEPLDYETAKAELKQARLMQPENIYAIEKIGNETE